jgi:hypothetical protein
MTLTTHRSLVSTAAAALVALGAACSGSQGGSSGTAAATSDALSTALASASASTGTLLCAPSQNQIDACASLAEGDACALTSPDGASTIAGTCRLTLDAVEVACAPNPPAPPAALVDACAASTLGDACQVTEPDGDSHDGVCVNAPGTTTLVCGRQHLPPQAAIDACSASTVGDGCALTNRDGQSVAGICTLGPAGTGPLACARAQELRPSATGACAGLAAGASCQLGHGPVAGTCVTPAEGGAAVCIAACADLGGRFRCGPRPGFEPHPPGSMDPVPPGTMIHARPRR